MRRHTMCGGTTVNYGLIAARQSNLRRQRTMLIGHCPVLQESCCTINQHALVDEQADHVVTGSMEVAEC